MVKYSRLFWVWYTLLRGGGGMGNEKKLKVYCETTFWSYLVGRQTTDEKIARDQAFTLK